MMIEPFKIEIDVADALADLERLIEKLREALAAIQALNEASKELPG